MREPLKGFFKELLLWMFVLGCFTLVLFLTSKGFED